MADEHLETYSLPIGLTFIFNLLLGTGVLTMPLVFSQAGYVSGLFVISSLCFMSYINVTFLIEAMANANFSSHLTELQNESQYSEIAALLRNGSDEENEATDLRGDQTVPFYRSHGAPSDASSSLIGNATEANPTIQGDPLGKVNPAFESDEAAEQSTYGTEAEQPELSGKLANLNVFGITAKFELGDMAQMFLSKILSQLFFVSIIVYLFGDLMIYNTMMAKSLRELSCTSKVNCNSNNTATYLDSPCWDSHTITRRNVYRIYLVGFIALLLPMIYAGLKKTASIQVITIILRWLAFFSMVGIALKILFSGQATGQPKIVNLPSIPKMFGICVYAFMCHHSIPSILTPVREKRHLLRGLTIDYVLVAGCYILIALTGIFAFGKLEDVYTLNFQINDCHGSGNTTNPATVVGFDIFLPSYPVFTLFSSYSFISLSLIANMKVLARSWTDVSSRWVGVSFPLIALIPSMLVSLFTEDVAGIVSYVGSYAGGLIQYVFPCLLVYYSRRIVKEKLASYLSRKMPSVTVNKDNQDRLYSTMNRLASPFQSQLWIYLTAGWWILSLILVTLDHILDAVNATK